MARKKKAMNAATEMLALAKKTMEEQFIESRWFKTAPNDAQAMPPQIEIVGIEHREVRVTEGGVMAMGTYKAPFLVGLVTLAGIQAKLALRLDFGRGGLIVDEQSAI